MNGRFRPRRTVCRFILLNRKPRCQAGRTRRNSRIGWPANFCSIPAQKFILPAQPQSKEGISGEWNAVASEVPGAGMYSVTVPAGAECRVAIEKVDGTLEEIGF